MLITDNPELISHPCGQHCFLARFTPVDFKTDGLSYSIDVSHIKLNSNSNERVTYEYHFSQTQSFFPYIIRNSGLRHALVRKGIIPEDFDENNPKLSPGYHALTIVVRPHIEPREDTTLFEFYNDEIELIIGDTPDFYSSSETILSFNQGTSHICCLRQVTSNRDCYRRWFYWDNNPAPTLMDSL